VATGPTRSTPPRLPGHARIETVLVVERGAVEQLRRLRVDDDLDGVAERGLLIVGGDLAVEEHLVGEPAAATGPDGDAQRQVVGTFGCQQLLDLAGCCIGQRDHGAQSTDAPGDAPG
jgi:hypothetical protein